MNDSEKIDLANIVGVYRDDAKMTQYIFTKDQLINQLRRVCPQIAASFDQVYDDEFKQLSAELSAVMALHYAGFREAIDSKDEVRICCGNLLRNASSTLIAAVDSLRNGFRLQSGILLRSIIEICATVVHIIVDPKAFEDFKSGKLNSTYSISFANKQIPLFGKPWGLLSNFHIHINTVHADWYPLHTYENKDEVPASVVLSIMGYTMLLLDIITEMVFIDELETPQFWKVNKPGELQFIPPKEDRTAWMEKLLKEKVIPAEPKSSGH